MISDYSVYRFSRAEAVTVVGAGYAGIFSLALLFYHSVILAAAAGTLSVLLLGPAGRLKAEKRKALLLSQFRDLLYSLSSQTAAGRQMDQALAGALDDLSMIYGPDTPMMMELKYIVKGVFENRENDEALLRDLAVRSGLEDIESFVDVYAACRRTGGDLGRVIGNATRVLTDKMTIEREIKALTSQKVFEGRIISAMPVLVVLFLNIFSPDYLEVMYTTVSGRILMTLALAGIYASAVMTAKILDISV